MPDEGFVGRLHQELVEQAEELEQADPRIVPIGRRPKVRRRRSAIAAIAAGLVLVGGTAAITEAVDQGAATPAAVPAPHGSSLRTGTFETTDGRVMGQVVVSRGNPSWVFLNVGGANDTGTIVCKLAGGGWLYGGDRSLHAPRGQGRAVEDHPGGRRPAPGCGTRDTDRLRRGLRQPSPEPQSRATPGRSFRRLAGCQ